MVVLAGVMVLAGAIQLRSSTVDVFPEFDPPLVEVQTEALGLSAAEVESLITVPLEADLLNGVAWLDEIHSESVAGLSSIVMLFEPGTDPIRARQMVQERLTQAHALPNVSKPPVMLQPLSSNSRVMMVGLSSDDMSLVELGVLARWNIKPRLLGVPGVANVAVWGHRDRQLQVLVDPTDLAAAGVTLDEVVETTGEALWVSPLTFLESSKPGTGGWIDTPNQRLGIRHLLPIASPEDLGKVPVVNHPDLVVDDIANVTESHQQLIGDATVNGETGMILVIERFPGADPVAVTQDVEETLSTMRAGLPGVDIDTDVFRPAGYVESMIGNLSTVLGIGLILAVALLALFLWSWRTAVIGFAVILTSLAVTLLVFDWWGLSLNIMTIGGLLIALGVIVDEVVVDTDNATRRLRQARDAGQAGPSRSAIFLSAIQTRRTLVSATILLLLAVLPVLFLQGLTGELFSPLAMSYAIAVVVSFAVAMLLTPGLTILLLGDIADAPDPSPVATRLESFHDVVTGLAGRIGRAGTLAIAGILAVVGLATLLLMSTAWTPTFEQDSARVRWEAAPGTSPAVMMSTIGTITDDLTAIDGVAGVSAHIGRAETGDLTVDINTADIWVRFAEDTDRAATVEAIERATADIPGSVEVLQTFIPERLDEALNGPDADVTVRVYGVDLEGIDAKANEIAELVDVVDGVSGATVPERVLEPQIDVTVDLETAEGYGILPGDVRRQATTLISGLQVGSLFEEQKVFDVVVWAEPELRDETSDFDSMPIDLPDGSQVPLNELARIETVDGPLSIQRDAVSRYADVNVTVDGRSAGAVADDIRTALREVTFEQESRAEIVGAAADGQGGRWRLPIVILAVLIGAYLLIQSVFGGWRLALGVMASALVALFGAVVGAVLTGGELTLPVVFGLLAVFGIAVRHAMLAIDHARRLELDAPEPGPELIDRAFRERAPAVLATTFIVAVFLAPALLFGSAPGLEILRPMAVVILCGLVTTLLSTMAVVPVLYGLFRAGTDAEDPIDREPISEIDLTESENGQDGEVEEAAAPLSTQGAGDAP
jgi:Cu/Ag efflux pump CusA